MVLRIAEKLDKHGPLANLEHCSFFDIRKSERRCIVKCTTVQDTHNKLENSSPVAITAGSPKVSQGRVKVTNT